MQANSGIQERVP
uniref:Uncharacterized protein n=1 Tax=Anguilla anguilla TaxID=7936 RepID=A0A0E9RHH0_ANGAN